ncbi:MAG TPA: hypothetical protein VN253_07070 [Kofleriaceae bacterium]|nr:hypothetical protein [Kofleriaceae bacterium]
MLAASCGAGLVRVLVLAIAALIFVITYLVTPSPGKLEYEPASFRPILAMRAGSLLAAAASGGLVSPLLPLVASRSRSRGRWFGRGGAMACSGC